MGKVKSVENRRHSRRSGGGLFSPSCCNKWHRAWNSSDTSSLTACPEPLLHVFKQIPRSSSFRKLTNTTTNILAKSEQIIQTAGKIQKFEEQPRAPFCLRGPRDACKNAMTSHVRRRLPSTDAEMPTINTALQFEKG